MPSFIHGTLSEEIGGDIIFWLRGILNRVCSNEGTIAAVKGIVLTGTSTIDFPIAPGLPDKKGPDKSFKHRQCKFPGLVMEVAWSQRKLDLPWLADHYIQRSKGEIRTVIGFNLNDIDSAKRKKGAKTSLAKAPATFSVWRAELDNSDGQTRVFVKNSVGDQVFRDQYGNPVPLVGLQLSLQDFICENVAGSFGNFENPQLVISAKSLCEHYEASLEAHITNQAQEESNSQLALQ
ncbi:hypothetical protein K469DRAFT_692127 [Zopfia rhizophila CBS 207.26]|uniref:Uncharacterized protein n=1 Tax=Zopfia rhizophila CBS 207.26 TaxID=1314779 RepID=A0A6A6DTF0_9PEZI|nr:hypothetical protein K469DRAFT_692127 [Zopfia rhizophila CBS 207.26]